MNARVLSATILVALLAAAFAQEATDPVTVSVAQSDQHGSFLADADGRALYLFVNEESDAQDPERMTEGVRGAAAPCTEGCLEAWPPLVAEEVQAGEGVDGELLYTADVNGTSMVVYNGWPLYYFARDEEPGQTNGQGVGRAPNIWYLVDPSGAIVGQDSGGEARYRTD